MANEIQAHAAAGLTLYAVLTNSTGQAWNGTTFETTVAANWTTYDIALTEATAGIYLGNMPSVIAGTYQYVVYERAGINPAITDTQRDDGTIAWTGSAVAAVGGTSYASLVEIKARLGITDAVDDTVLTAVLDAISRGIDNYCKRFFYTTAAGTVRYYTPSYSDHVLIDDCVTLTEVKTDDDGDRTYPDTWAATDYDLLPENAATDSLPYTEIAVTPDGDYDFPVKVRKGLKLTGTWGWPAVPAPVEEACLIQTARVFKRKDAPFGITGTPELGQMRLGRFDPDVQWLLETYRTPTVA